MTTTVDALLDGLVVYEQPARGYRVALEAPLLARFAIEGRRRPFHHALDLGAGCGAVGLMLAKTGWAERVTAVELDGEHARLAIRNAAANGLTQAMTVVRSDVGATAELPPADLVVANPPWFETDSGGVALLPPRAAARAFVHGSLAEFIRVARRNLAPRGRVVLSVPASRSMETIAMLVEQRLQPKRLRFVHPREGREAHVLFVEAKPGKPGGVVVESPLIVRELGEDYTKVADDALRGRWPTVTRVTE